MSLLDLVRTMRHLLRSRHAMVRLAATLAAGASGATLGACTEPVEAVPVASMRIVPQQDSFFVGVTAAANPFAITLFNAVGQEIRDGRAVTYSSGNQDVFTVDAASGLVTGKALGTAALRATSGGRFVEAMVKIIHPVATIQFLPGNFGFNVGTTRTLIVSLFSADNSPITGRVVTFTSSNPGVVSISANGIATAVDEGQATITVSVEGKSASLVATVSREAVASVRMSPPIAPTMRVGGQLQLTATPLNALGQPLSGRTVTWFVNNPTAASVSSEGVVTALAVGNVTVTAEIEGRTASLPITITEIPPISVTIAPDTFQLATGVTRQIIPVVIDSLGREVPLTNRTVAWSTTNPAVASVNGSGVVAGISGGTSRISVTVDGVRSNEIVVQVSQQVALIRITPNITQLIRVGGMVQLSATAFDNNNQPIPGKTITWQSLNPTIASVSQSGLVTGLAIGGTTIFAQSDNVSAQLAVNVTPVPIGSVTLVPDADTLVVGDVKQYNPIVRDTANRIINPPYTGRSITWQTTNIPVASVSGAGVVSAASQGTAAITVTVDGVTSNTLAMRVAQVATVTVSPSPGTVPIGQTLQLTVVLRDLQGNILTTSRPVSFSTSAGGIATVSPAGIVTGVAAGQATIFASINGVIGQTLITVQ